MCGLTLSIRLLPSPTETIPSPDPIFTSLVMANSTRGPDASNTYTHLVSLPTGETIELSLAASVLGLRGREVVSQPVLGEKGVLGWNGQVSQRPHLAGVEYSENHCRCSTG